MKKIRTAEILRIEELIEEKREEVSELESEVSELEEELEELMGGDFEKLDITPLCKNALCERHAECFRYMEDAPDDRTLKHAYDYAPLMCDWFLEEPEGVKKENIHCQAMDILQKIDNFPGRVTENFKQYVKQYL